MPERLLVFTVRLQIPVNEAYIGSIIGRAGSVIQEIMSYSGARVQVSQKGEYITGTQERIVSVTGTPAAVQAAQYVITEKVQNAALLGNSFR
jgi:RNA-binding protein Nova